MAGSLALALAVALAGPAAAKDDMPFRLTSPAFEQGASIPPRFTCEGEDVSPALAWSAVPEGATHLALIVEDPDAPDPDAPKRTWVHWVLYDLPAAAGGLAEGVPANALPSGTRPGTNDWRRTGWGGPCPPIGRHRYFFRLYALDGALGDLGTPDAKALRDAMRGHVVGEATLMGTYEKRGQ